MERKFPLSKSRMVFRRNSCWNLNEKSFRISDFRIIMKEMRGRPGPEVKDFRPGPFKIEETGVNAG